MNETSIFKIDRITWSKDAENSVIGDLAPPEPFRVEIRNLPDGDGFRPPVDLDEQVHDAITDSIYTYLYNEDLSAGDPDTFQLHGLKNLVRLERAPGPVREMRWVFKQRNVRMTFHEDRFGLCRFRVRPLP